MKLLINLKLATSTKIHLIDISSNKSHHNDQMYVFPFDENQYKSFRSCIIITTRFCFTNRNNEVIFNNKIVILPLINS